MEKFIGYLTENLENKFGKEFKVIEEDSKYFLEVAKGEISYMRIPLERYYNKVQEGVNREEILEVIENLVESTNRVELEVLSSFENNKGKITCIFENLKSSCIADEVPKIQFLDLSIVCLCTLAYNEDYLTELLVTNGMLESWGITKEELFKVAFENTLALKPASVKTLTDAMVEAARESALDEISSWVIENGKAELLGIFGDYTNIIMNAMLEESENPVDYVVTNQNSISGAIALLYADLSKLEGDYYVVPTSIHEIVLTPAVGELTLENVRDSVVKVNQTELEEEEVLSNEVYVYHAENDTLEWKGEVVKRAFPKLNSK